MFATTHMIVGGAVASRIKNPYVALPAAFASHFALDGIPHIDLGSVYPGTAPPVMINAAYVAVSVVLGILFIRGQGRAGWVLLGVLMGMLPDSIASLGRAWPEFGESSVMRALSWLHYTHHPSLPGSGWIPGLSTQVVVIALAFCAVRRRIG